MSGISKVLVVDDEKIVRELLEIYLRDLDLEPMFAEDGVEGWNMLKEHYNDIDLILLDRMMPNMDGMEVMKKIKAHPVISSIPVIMQTAACSPEEVHEGMATGVFHYLVKPYDDVTLQMISRQALGRYKEAADLRHKLSTYQGIVSHLDECKLSFKTLEEGEQVCAFIASFYPSPDLIVVGISELIINAVEHGNLGISFDEKTKLHQDGKWFDEIRERQAKPEYADKEVTIHFSKSPNEIKIKVCDQGEGFDWKLYTDINPEMLTMSHGRGIPMCKHMFFDDLSYNDKGNEVEAVMRLDKN